MDGSWYDMDMYHEESSWFRKSPKTTGQHYRNTRGQVTALSHRNIAMISSNWSKVICVFKAPSRKETKVTNPTSQARFLPHRIFFFFFKCLKDLVTSFVQRMKLTFLWLKFLLKSLVTDKGVVVITLMNKVMLEVTNEGTKHVVIEQQNQAPALPSVRRLEIIFNALRLALYKRGKGQRRVFK